MTPTQTQQAIRIMQKHGQEGWKIFGDRYGLKPVEEAEWKWQENSYHEL